ncbi:MAG: hypothetical protein JST65_13860 [Acidobacteria bacterium]|nr:hypothetical protein [Acidobacteriota bacterium]
MAEFQTMSGATAGTKVTGVAGDSLALKLVPSAKEPMADTIAAVPSTVATIANIAHRAKAHFSTFQIKCVTKGAATVTASAAGKTLAGPLSVEVLEKLVLPASNTDAGLLARLFLAEVASPGASSWKLEDAKACMTLMRIVLENRLAKPSSRWSSSGAKTLGDVVRAPSQFQGFSKYPTLSADVQSVIDDILSVANKGGDRRMANNRAHVEAAIAVASGAKPADPTKTGLYWWRTAGSGAPGTGISVYKTTMGNTFYQEGAK